MKKLFKMWIEADQLERLQAMVEQGKKEDPPPSVASLIRRAIETAYPPKGKKK
jgi:hypothetical protein